MSKQDIIREGIDRIICEAIDPEIPYEEQSAPLLDWSWSYMQKILRYLHSEGVVIKADRDEKDPCDCCEFNDEDLLCRGTCFEKTQYVDRIGLVAVEPLIKEEK